MRFLGGRKEGLCGGGVGAVEAEFDEVGMGGGVRGEREELDVRVDLIIRRGCDEVTEVDECVSIAH